MQYSVCSAYVNVNSNQPTLTIQDTKQNKQNRYTSTIPTHTHHCPHYDRPHTTPHQEFKILLTPGVFKRNRLHLIGCPEAFWLWLVDDFINLLQCWLSWVIYHNTKYSKKWSTLHVWYVLGQGTKTHPKGSKIYFRSIWFSGIYQKTVFPIQFNNYETLIFLFDYNRIFQRRHRFAIGVFLPIWICPPSHNVWNTCIVLHLYSNIILYLGIR